MRRKSFLIVPVLLGVLALATACNGASIIWDTLQPAADSEGDPLSGTRAFGPVNLSNGALLQLYKAVGDIDDPRMVQAAYENADWVVDDVLLDEIHAGYGYGPPGGAAGGLFAHTVDVDVAVDDVLYVRAFNVAKGDFLTTPLLGREIGIRDSTDMIVTNTVTTVDPTTYYFSDLRTEPIPEPASLLFLLPGLAIWGLRRKK